MNLALHVACCSFLFHWTCHVRYLSVRGSSSVIFIHPCKVLNRCEVEPGRIECLHRLPFRLWIPKFGEVIWLSHILLHTPLPVRFNFHGSKLAENLSIDKVESLHLQQPGRDKETWIVVKQPLQKLSNRFFFQLFFHAALNSFNKIVIFCFCDQTFHFVLSVAVFSFLWWH